MQALIFLYVSFGMIFCLSNSSHMLTISFITPVCSACLLASSRFNRSISAFGSLKITIVFTSFSEYKSFHIGLIIFFILLPFTKL